MTSVVHAASGDAMNAKGFFFIKSGLSNRSFTGDKFNNL